MGNQRRKTGGGKNCGGEEDTPLHVAARAGDLIAARAICTSNPLSVNSRDKHSRTPLHLAAWSGHQEMVRYLCGEKAEVGATAMDDMAAIHFASQKGHLEVVRALVAGGASVRAATRKGWTALHYAVKGSHIELAKYLIRKGADLSTETKSGETVLELAGGNETLVAALSECKKEKEKEKEEKGRVLEMGERNMAETRDGEDGVALVTTLSEGAKERESLLDEKMVEKRQEGENPVHVRPPKKPRVVLSHLNDEDDVEQEE